MKLSFFLPVVLMLVFSVPGWGSSLGCNQVAVGTPVYTTGQIWDGYPTQDAAPIQCIDAIGDGGFAGQEFFPLSAEPGSGFAFAVLDNGVKSNQDFIDGYNTAIVPYEAYLSALFGAPCCSAGEQTFLPGAIQDDSVTGNFSACFAVDPCTSGMPLEGSFLLTDTGQMYLNWTIQDTMNGTGVDVSEFNGFTPVLGARPYRGDISVSNGLPLSATAEEATELSEARPINRHDIPEPASFLLLGSLAFALAVKRFHKNRPSTWVAALHGVGTFAVC